MLHPPVRTPAFLAAVPLIGLIAAVGPAQAIDESMKAESRAPTAIALCKREGNEQLPKECKAGGALDRLIKRTDAAFKAALARARPATAPLLKRDQVWFRDLLEGYGENSEAFADDDDEDRPKLTTILAQRTATLGTIAQGFGRQGITGRWANVFGTAEVKPAAGGALRITVATRSVYGVGSEQRPECHASALVRPSPSGWFEGTIDPSSQTDGEHSSNRDAKPALMRARLQGETLRIVAGDESTDDVRPLDCSAINQITGTYFAAGGGATTPKPGSAPFVAPSFDCARLTTADEEEICADPELAENDVRLNKAWRALLPRLDAATQQLLRLDQRGYVESQATQYAEFLHPAWEKRSSDKHHTGYGRDQLFRLQRERIAVLEGFDETRQGFEGLWMAHNAMLEIKRTDDGKIAATGWRWFQGDWKAGCDYEIKGTVKDGVLRSDEQRPNPDTLEREHASLIVNRLDDALAEQRTMVEGEPDTKAGEPKCKRNITISSTARLFPVRPSPDINNIGGSIR